MDALIQAPLLGHFIVNTPSRLSVFSGRGERLYARSGYVSATVDVGQQSQRIDIVVAASVDVGDRYSVANSS
jgi:1-aminocyclopropane-1-carboxylate deaminase/D-cysteine desulfhydrase-like pyridoxal-dependent ACC family enzyme